MKGPRLRWSIDGVEVAFSTAADGDVRSPVVRNGLLASVGCPYRCVVPGQVHGAVIVDAAAGERDLAIADGVATSNPSTALAVFGADCPGLVLAARDALVLAHCGWRGTAAGIVEESIAAMTRRSACGRSEWAAFIGPGICGEHYEIDTPVLDARAWPAHALARRRGGHAHLDLPSAIAHDLHVAGIQRVRRSGVCTAEDDRLWSYRRRGGGLVQALVAWRAPISDVDVP